MDYNYFAQPLTERKRELLAKRTCRPEEHRLFFIKNMRIPRAIYNNTKLSDRSRLLHHLVHIFIKIRQAKYMCRVHPRKDQVENRSVIKTNWPLIKEFGILKVLEILFVHRFACRNVHRRHFFLGILRSQWH